MDADILSIGTEVSTGAVVNTNTAWLARALMAVGIVPRRHVTVGDRLDAVRDEITRAAREVEVVIVTGGLGPTLDDMTRDALAAALGRPLERDEASVEHIRNLFRKMNRPMHESNLQQALVPRGARTLENPWGTAPGLRAELHRAVVFCLPGVPREMERMFERHVVPELRERCGAAVAVRVLRTFGQGESFIGQQIAAFMDPARNPSVGTQASEGLISVRIIGRADSGPEAQRLVYADAEAIRAVLGEIVFGEDDDTLPGVVGRMLAERGLTLATAESCTGGMIAASITDVSGSSRYFLRGYVTYSNESKSELLGVPLELIAAHGAVSEPVAEAMAVGCLQRAGADYALSVTGVAGPTGGTADKPVGLVFVGLADRSECRVHRLQFSDHLNRWAIRDRTCKTALNLLRLRLLA
jgi:nicotinamide-nucleotide amidase